MSDSVSVKDPELSQVIDAHSGSTDSSTPVRPPISFASPSAFALSVYVRFLSLWTPSFVRSMFYGQVLSLSLTATSVMTTELVMRNWVLPSTQVIFPYVFMFITYTPYTIYRYGLKGWGNLILYDGWKYFILALCDCEASFLYVKAFGYTDLMSCMLLDAWSIPICMFACWIAMRVRYHWTQIAGVVICIGGLALLVTSDLLTGKDGEAKRMGEGDGFMLLASTLFGFDNAAEEFFVRQSPLYEVLGQMGLWGVLISTTQASITEREKWKVSTWDGATVGLLMANTIFTFMTYVIQMLLFRVASSPYFNMSLLTSDFYGLLFGLFLFHYSPYWLYFVAFAIVILGLIVYFWYATPEEQGIVNIKFPRYVNVKSGEGTEKDAA